MLDVWVDELTPCLINSKTGKIVETTVKQILDTNFLEGKTKTNGWGTNWKKLLIKYKCEIYALYTNDSSEIQGLVALTRDHEAKAIHIMWICANPKSQGKKTKEKEYLGIGGHLFAIASKISLESKETEGYMYGDAKNGDLVKHYVEVFGAVWFRTTENPNRIVFYPEVSKKLEKEYTYEIKD